MSIYFNLKATELSSGHMEGGGDITLRDGRAAAESSDLMSFLRALLASKDNNQQSE